MIWVILTVGLILRIISLNQSLWFDEGINIMAVKNYSFTGMVTGYAVADFHPPGWFAVLWIFGKLFGYSETALRIPSVFFGLATIYTVYLLGKKLLSQKAGYLAALILAVNPLHIYYSQEARMYAMAAFAAAVNMLLFVKLLKSEKVNMIIYALSVLFVLLSDYIAYFIFPSQLIFLFWIRKKEIIQKWILLHGAATVLNFWWWPVFLKQLDTGSAAAASLPTWKFVAGAFDFKTLPLTFVKFIIGRISMADKVLYALMLAPLLGLFSFIIFRGIKSAGKFSRVLLASWLLIPLLFATVISLFIPVYSYFRVLYVVSAFCLVLAAGILSFKKYQKYFLALVILIEVSASLLYLLFPSNQRENWKGLAEFFKKNNPDALILLESSGTFPAFEYYAKGELNIKGGLADFPARDESAVSGLSSLTKEKNEVYLVDYLVQISDPERLLAKKLTELNFKEVETKDFRGVGFVYRYVKN